jgi:radical SAM protein with 4Fe4S-binding SPASM domain
VKNESKSPIVKKYDNNLQKIEDELSRVYGERYTTYRKNYQAASELEFEPEFPLYVMLEQTYSCNLKCPSCIHGFSDDKKKFNPDTKIMPRDLFEQIILEGETNNCPSIAFHVNDEPLIVPDLPDRIAYAKSHGFMDLLVTTNGTLLNPKLIRNLIDSGLTRILFSIDAATSATYDKVRPGLKEGFDRVWENLNTLVEMKKSRNLILPAIRASFVESEINRHEREAFIQKFSGLVDYIDIQAFSSYYDRNLDLIPKGAEKVSGYKCSAPWNELIIRTNGDVLPCCSFYGYEIVVGNIYKTSLKDIFLGKYVKQLRKDFKEGIYKLPSCQACADSFYVLS